MVSETNYIHDFLPSGKAIFRYNFFKLSKSVTFSNSLYRNENCLSYGQMEGNELLNTSHLDKKKKEFGSNFPY